MCKTVTEACICMAAGVCGASLGLWKYAHVYISMLGQAMGTSRTFLIMRLQSMV